MVEMLVTLRPFMSYSLQMISFNTTEFKTGELLMAIIYYLIMLYLATLLISYTK